jgi:hypothetical protein
MDITSPFFVVPLIVIAFFASLFFSTSSKEDVPSTDDAMHPDTRHMH